MVLCEADIRPYMERCIELGGECRGRVCTPFVGSVVLSSNGRVIGQGYKRFLDHTHYLLHAERVALDEAGESAIGGTLITTLEPCVQGPRNNAFKPCTELIVERKIANVVFGLYELRQMQNRVSNGSEVYLEKCGIEVFQYTDLNELIEHKLMRSMRNIIKSNSQINL